MSTIAAQPLGVAAQFLRRAGYASLQFLPGHHQRIGKEWLMLRTLLRRDDTTVLRGSALHSLYRRLSALLHPEVERLYRPFFLCEPRDAAEFAGFFGPEQVDGLLAGGLLAPAGDGRLCCTVRFVPVDDLLVTSSPARDYATERFVYLGSDTVLFQRLLAGHGRRETGTVLEIGCGSALLSLGLSRHAAQVTATDISPAALALARTNVAINGIGNVDVIASDVYAGVTGRFDAIVSNPPYMFLPEADAVRLHAYGGHFGTAITRRILEGLDAHLVDDGTAYLFVETYVRDDGSSTLHELMREVFDGKPWHVVMRQVDWQPILQHHDFYRAHRIAHSIRYFITVRRSSGFRLDDIALSGVAQVVERLKVRAAQSRGRAGQSRGRVPGGA